MENAKTAANTELENIDKALRRAALSAKKQAEQQGTPYVVYDVANDQTEKNK